MKIGRVSLKAVLLLLALGPPSLRATQAATRGSLSLDGTGTIFVLPDEPEPVLYAAEDLASDFRAVTGNAPTIVRSADAAAGQTIVIGEDAKLPESLRSAGVTAAESFSISIRPAVLGQRSMRAVVLTGADMRGTMYAVYEFSEKQLGIDPMYYWTDNEPAHRMSINLPESLQENFPAPVFRYRGFFINDEDLLTGWSPGEAQDHTGISLDVWKKVYETTLRLKGNIVAPGTWIFPDDPQVKLAATRGLVVTQHHAIPLGLNVARWPQDVSYNYTTHPEILQRAWQNAVRLYLPNQEVLWSVGLRGLSDVTYASMDPSVQNDNRALGRLITKAIADQISIVRELRPDAKFVTNLWQEGARLVQQKLLTIPSDVATVWADDGYGYLQDAGNVTAGQGAYDHVAMMNGRANQLTEMVPVERSLSEMGRYIKAGATNYFLVNTSDIRPVAMSTEAVMNIAWRGLPKDASTADDFYRQWATAEFGEAIAPELAALYKEYFKAPAHSGDPIHEYGDQLYHTEARQMLLTYMTDAPLYSIPGQAPKWTPPRILLPGMQSNRPTGKEWLREALPREIQQCGDAQARWDAVWDKATAMEPRIPTARQSYYRAQVLAMIAINRASNRILYSISKAIQAAQAKNRNEAHEELAQALSAFDDIEHAEAAAEYGKWKNWYRGDWLTGVYRTRQLVQVMDRFIDDPETHLAPPVLWDGWEAYYHIMHYERDRTADVQAH